MRVTNRMLVDNMMNNINKNKQNVNTRGDQYATGQKIQRPSEDPVVAVRTLKYRTQLIQLNQYYEKNIPDAEQWMNVTESAMSGTGSQGGICDILTKMNTYFNQGANDTLTPANRESLDLTLEEYMEQIYQYANTDYAGRYVFTGYRTDEPLLFLKDTSNYKYEITEELPKDNATGFTYVKSGLPDTLDTAKSAADYAGMAPTFLQGYRMTLSYKNIEGLTGLSYTKTTKNADGSTTKITVDQNGTTTGGTDTAGNPITPTTDATKKLNFAVIKSGDANAYDIEAYNAANGTDYDALVLKDTGEIMLTQQTYLDIKDSDGVKADYVKKEFDKGDAKPEHYFDCTRVTLDTDGNELNETRGNYTKPGAQHIQYEINFSQKLTINTMANQFLTADLKRQVEDAITQLNRVKDVENQIAQVKKRLDDGTLTGDDLEAAEEYKKQLENKLALEERVLQETFAHGLTVTQNAENEVNAAVADLGSRMKRLELTKDRLSNQQVDFTDMLKSNDGVELEDAIINYTSAKTQYNASLNAATKLMSNTLLDFL